MQEHAKRLRAQVLEKQRRESLNPSLQSTLLQVRWVSMVVITCTARGCGDRNSCSTIALIRAELSDSVSLFRTHSLTCTHVQLTRTDPVSHDLNELRNAVIVELAKLSTGSVEALQLMSNQELVTLVRMSARTDGCVRVHVAPEKCV